MRRGLTAVLAALLTVGLAACGPDTAGQVGQGEQSGQEAPKTFSSDRELVEEFLKDIQAGKVSRASELLSGTPKSIQSDKDAKALSVRLSNASINSMNDDEVTVHFDFKGLDSERQMRLYLTDTTQGRRIKTDSVVYPGDDDDANDITPAGLSEGMFFVPGLYGAERYDSSWRTVEKVPVDYDGAVIQADSMDWDTSTVQSVSFGFDWDEVDSDSDE